MKLTSNVEIELRTLGLEPKKFTDTGGPNSRNPSLPFRLTTDPDPDPDPDPSSDAQPYPYPYPHPLPLPLPLTLTLTLPLTRRAEHGQGDDLRARWISHRRPPPVR